MAWTPEIGRSGLSGLFYVDGRLTDDYNTGSDLFPQKEQDSYAMFNARIGIRGPDESWAIEVLGAEIFNQKYHPGRLQLAVPGRRDRRAVPDPQFPGGRQIFSAFLAEPRTYGITGRFRF